MEDRTRELLVLGGAALVIYELTRKKEATIVPTALKYKLDFVKAIYGPAETVMREQFGPDNINAKRDAAITQASHESDWGRSGLASRYRNIFGFKAGEAWLKAGKPVANLWTSEQKADGTWYKVQAPFRAYASWEESLRDWARLIKTSSRYKVAADALYKGDAHAFFVAIGESGYATDQTYGGKLARVYTDVQGAVV